MVVKDVACDGLPCVVSGLGTYMGVSLGLDSAHMPWRDSVRKLLSRARRIKSMALSAAQTPVAYNYLASVLAHPGRYFDPDSAALRAEQVAFVVVVVVHSAPMYTLSPEIATRLNLAGDRVACTGIERLA